VIPLNQTVTSFARAYAAKHGAHSVQIAFHPPGKEWDREAWVKNAMSSKSWVIFLHGNGIWGRWFTRDATRKAQRNVAFSPFLRNMSIKIVRAVLGEPFSFNAVHGRLGDLRYKWGQTTSEYFVREARRRGWRIKTKVYLASDSPDDAFFRGLKSEYPVVDWKSLKYVKEVQDYMSLFPEKSGMQEDMFGVLDKLICAQAGSFIGTEFSTFTMEIKIMRSILAYVFPEAQELKNSAM